MILLKTRFRYKWFLFFSLCIFNFWAVDSLLCGPILILYMFCKAYEINNRFDVTFTTQCNPQHYIFLITRKVLISHKNVPGKKNVWESCFTYLHHIQHYVKWTDYWYSGKFGRYKSLRVSAANEVPINSHI